MSNYRAEKNIRPWYLSYRKAKERCEYKKADEYHRYGGRGIKILMTCEDVHQIWIRDNADKMKRPSLDRIDPDGNYEISNCRYIELSENCGRRRNAGGIDNPNCGFIKEVPCGFCGKKLIKKRWSQKLCSIKCTALKREADKKLRDGEKGKSMKILYSIKGQDSDVCHELSHFKEMLKFDDHFNSYELEEWEPKLGTGTFWCKENGEGYESGDGVCGAFECVSYSPRNGRSGRCRWHSTPYHPTGRTLRIEK